MAGKVATPDQIRDMVALRSSGWTVAAISEHTGNSPATVNRYLIKHKAIKGSLTSDSIKAAQDLLLAQTTGDMALRISTVLEDDFAIFLQLRQALSIAVDKLTQDDSLPSHYVLRGLAAAAVSMTATQAAIRKTLNMNDIPILQSDLPTLEIKELTAADIEVLRQEQLVLSGLDTVTYDNGVIESVD